MLRHGCFVFLLSEVVEYQDNNRDDPMRWGAQFVTLRPSAD
ncbi:hypothetical protein AKJ09_08023 [Labilithrix luteola]|uniref:Uncharacterized protein n=1 Tax=Labilithrix luteola TaxID=1391654 RepID=A0A0K1Q7I5_9BACT|nr:hypothetical protein AKJ09_08023 [Labilithrix luteola]